MNLAEHCGNIDIYLFDQILRGRIRPGMRILDAGCGTGRNLVYFLNEGYDVHGVDLDAEVIAGLPASGHFQVGSIESLPFPDEFADVVIANTVLHFARDDDHFKTMLDSLWRVLKPGGLLFCRLASTIGMEGRFQPLGGRRYLLLDGTQRYLVDQPLLLEHTRELGARLLDPLKTTVVQDMRSMTTWVLEKPS